MNKLSQELDAIARNSEALLLREINNRGLNYYAQSLGIDNSNVCRFKSDHLLRFCTMLALSGLKIVPNEQSCIDDETYKALKVLAIKGLESE